MKLARNMCWRSGGHYYVVDSDDANRLMTSYETVYLECEKCSKRAYLVR